MTNRGLDLAALRLDAAARLNGGARESRVGPDLARRLAQFERERDALRRERAAVRLEAHFVCAAWVLLLVMTCILCGFWPQLMALADRFWAR